MRILAFDTATRATAVALDAGGERVLEARDDPPTGERPGHAAKLLPLAAGLLVRAGIDWGDLELIAVGVGPGTFTGLRIGIATGRALSQALSAPIVGVSTLQSLALGARQWPEVEEFELVVPVLDARRGEVFAAAWPRAELENPAGAVLAPAALAPAQLADRLSELGSSVLAIGEGAVEFRTELERSGASVPEAGAEVHRVTAVGHCRIARRLDTSSSNAIVPEYLRAPDAREPSPSPAADEQ